MGFISISNGLGGFDGDADALRGFSLWQRHNVGGAISSMGTWYAFVVAAANLLWSMLQCSSLLGESGLETLREILINGLRNLLWEVFVGF